MEEEALQAYAFYNAASGERIGGPYSLYKLFQVPNNASMTDPGCTLSPALRLLLLLLVLLLLLLLHLLLQLFNQMILGCRLWICCKRPGW